MGLSSRQPPLPAACCGILAAHRMQAQIRHRSIAAATCESPTSPIENFPSP